LDVLIFEGISSISSTEFVELSLRATACPAAVLLAHSLWLLGSYYYYRGTQWDAQKVRSPQQPVQYYAVNF
jgi:hypothetical protein